MARQNLGQHFLKDRDVAERIIGSILPEPGGILLEIGPGKGILTRMLSEKFPHKTIIAVEKDRALHETLLKNEIPGVRFLNRDILDLDLNEVTGKSGVTILGNIPYYISKEIIDWVIKGYGHIASGLFMVQREFFMKITSDPRSKQTNAQSVLFSLLYESAHMFDVRPGSFSPPPKIISTVFTFRKKNVRIRYEAITGFYAFLQTAFAHRRKTLVNNLSGAYPRETLIRYLQEKNLPGNSRAEDLSPEHFFELGGRCLTF